MTSGKKDALALRCDDTASCLFLLRYSNRTYARGWFVIVQYKYMALLFCCCSGHIAWFHRTQSTVKTSIYGATANPPAALSAVPCNDKREGNDHQRSCYDSLQVLWWFDASSFNFLSSLRSKKNRLVARNVYRCARAI